MANEGSHNESENRFHFIDRADLENLIGRQIANAIPRIAEAIRGPANPPHSQRIESQNSQPRNPHNDVTHPHTNPDRAPSSHRRPRTVSNHSEHGDSIEITSVPKKVRTNRRCTYKNFLDCKPIEFSGK